MKTKGIESGAPRPSQLSGQSIEAQKPAKQSPADLPSEAVIPFGGRDLFRFDGGDTIQPQLPEAPPPALVGTRRWIDATSGVGLDCAEGMPLLNGHRPSSWSEGAEAFYRLSKAAARSIGDAIVR